MGSGRAEARKGELAPPAGEEEEEEGGGPPGEGSAGSRAEDPHRAAWLR